MIYYCCPVLNQHHNLLKWCDAAMSGSVKPDKLLIIDNSGRYLCETIDFGEYPVEVLYQDENLGVGPSWNVFLEKTYGKKERLHGKNVLDLFLVDLFGVSGLTNNYCIIANDDVFVHSQTIEHLINAAETDENNVFFHGSGHSGNSFSLFLLTELGYHTVGGFDQMFWPGYFEDNDYHRRLRLLGLDIIGIDEATFDHIGSATVASFTKQQSDVQIERFRRNQMYYQLKWGGIPSQETYTIPYNGNKERVVEVITEKYGY